MTFSLCMIVKNEADILARCLDCVKDLMDEIIIVDTGSSDSTKEIAHRYTDRVYDFVWQNDFSAARNFAFSLATKDYIYSADADEIIDTANRERFRKLKKVLLPEIDIVQMIYSNQLEYNTTYNFDSELRPKLYRRQRSFIWEGSLHETVRLDPCIYDSDIEIIHKPRSSHSKRDFSLYIETIAKDGVLSGKLQAMYARELAVSGTDIDFTDAREYFAEAVERDGSEETVREDLFILIKAARISNDKDEMMRYSLRAAAIGTTSEEAFEFGEYYRIRHDYEEAAMWYYNAAHETASILNRKYAEEYPAIGLDICKALSAKKRAAGEDKIQG